MASALVAALLATVVYQLARIIRRLDRAALIASATKIHLREAKEEHWAALNAIHWALLAQIDVDERIPAEIKHRLHDTPAQLGDAGRWRYHMPNNYLEVDWQGSNVMPDEHTLRGRLEAAERVRHEAGLKRKRFWQG